MDSSAELFQEVSQNTSVSIDENVCPDHISCSQSHSSDKTRWRDQHYKKQIIDDKSWFVCRYYNCPKRYCHSNSHQVLKNHWAKQHNLILNKSTTFTFDNNALKSQIVKFIIMGQHEYRLVEEKEFNIMMKLANPSYSHVSRKFISEIINIKYHEVKSRIKDSLANVSYVSLTFDLWSKEKSAPSYGCITCHHLTDKFQPKNFVLNFERIPYPHNDDTLCDFLLESIRYFGIEDKTVAITTDNAGSNISALELLKSRSSISTSSKRMVHIRCAAHILNLAAQDALGFSDMNLSTLRDIIKIISSSRKRLEEFEALQKERG